MRYLCVQCDEKFELEAEAELRCPKCMRVHGLRQLATSGEPPSARGGRRGLFVGALLVLLLLGGGAAYLVWKREQSPDAATLASTPLRERVLRRELAARGADVGALAELLAPDAAVERFARDAARGRATPADKARGVVEALRARAAKQAFVAWSLSDPRVGGPPMVAAKVLGVITKDGARAQLYPLELAVLAVAALRALDVPAMLAEVYALPGGHGPLDPSGRFGYFAPALLATAGAKPDVFDVYGGRPEQKSCADCAVLSDLEAIGAALSLQASQRLARNEDPAAALRDTDVAVKLLPSSATVRSARGAVLLSNGASDLGQSELEAAAQMHPDAPRRNNLAMIYLALGDAERASREVASVLEQEPDFALGHATLAEIHLASGERALARAELDRAQELEPSLPSLALTWAQYYAAAGENEQAIAYARRAVSARQSDPQAHIVLARIYRQAGAYEEMRAEARTVLALAPQALAGRTRELLERLLGPTALETEPSAEPTAGGPSGAGEPAVPSGGELPDPGHLDLSQGLGAGRSGPRLLRDSSQSPSAGTLKPGDGPPRLQLSQPGKTP
jgi:tetratricopeptide (TPR) repeat protein